MGRVGALLMQCARNIPSDLMALYELQYPTFGVNDHEVPPYAQRTFAVIDREFESRSADSIVASTVGNIFLISSFISVHIDYDVFVTAKVILHDHGRDKPALLEIDYEVRKLDLGPRLLKIRGFVEEVGGRMTTHEWTAE